MGKWIFEEIKNALLGFAPPLDQFLQLADHTVGRKARIHRNGQCFPIEIINDIQCADCLAASQRIMHEIKAPSNIRSDRA